MFKQLVSNLPFNPSLIGQIGFYINRLKKETSFRRIGFICMVLAMLVQMIAIISPPEKSLAVDAGGHIIDGIQTRDDILTAWDRAGSDIPSIYSYFGVTRANIESLSEKPDVTIRSNDGNDWWTTGRSSLSGRSDVDQGHKDTEIAIVTNSSTTVYMRSLRAWDIRNPYNTYKAWQGTKADGSTFWILQDCGNYTQIGKIPPKTPDLELQKSIRGNPSTLKPGDKFSFILEWRNAVPDSVAENVVLDDVLDLDHFTVLSPNLPINGKYVAFNLGSVPYTRNNHITIITVQLKNPLPDGLQLCNAAKIAASNAADDWGGPACFTISNPPPPGTPPPTPPPPTTPACPYNTSIPIDSSECVVSLICSSLDAVIKPGTREVTFSSKAISTNQNFSQINSYTYDFGDGQKQTNNSGAYTDTAVHSYATGDYTASVTIDYTLTEISGSKTPKQAVCTAPLDFESEKPVGQTKTVKNITQNLEGEAAVGSTVKAGDELEYTLTTINSHRYNKDNFVIEDYIGDILDYSDLDIANLESSGGKFDPNTKKISWTENILANSEVTKTFRVKTKNPIPATNSPSSVSTSFDCKISNRYGNEIGMQVACPAVKNIETLPNTGPGTSLIGGFLITAIIGYFFARSRLLSKEMELVRTDYGSAGV